MLIDLSNNVKDEKFKRDMIIKKRILLPLKRESESCQLFLIWKMDEKVNECT